MDRATGVTGKKVLIVDDSAVVRRNLKKLLLGQPGIAAVSETHSVYSTLQHLATERPDAIIVDIQLPDGTGFEILEYLADELGVKEGQTTADKMFSLERVACLGCCGMAPVIMIDGDFYGTCTIKKLEGILDKDRAEKTE